MSRLADATNEKQTCAICMRTIRWDTRWFHVTECPQPHYFHYDCWSAYRLAEQSRMGQTGSLRWRCPTCRRLQISSTDMSLALSLMLGKRCARCLRQDPAAPSFMKCGHCSCQTCLEQYVEAKADTGLLTTCPVCERTLASGDDNAPPTDATEALRSCGSRWYSTLL